MPLKIKKPESQFVLPAEGEHLAKLQSYEDQGEQEDRFNPGQTVHRMQLVWRLKGGSDQYQWVKVSLHPLSRFHEIATALLQAEPPEELNVDDLLGKSAILTIEHYKAEKGGLRSKVTDIRPVHFKGRKLPPPVEDALEPEDGEEMPF